jgi:NTP pyrophosphatase (non-canonical NTP hydrolase)
MDKEDLKILNTYTDKCFQEWEFLEKSVLIEHQHQINKWGIQTHTLFEWLTYTAEELGELAKAIAELEYRDGTKEEVYKEAIQTATLSLKIAEMVLSEKTNKRGDGVNSSQR